MKRECFLCGRDGDNFSNHIWELPGVGTAEIGFAICSGCGMVFQTPTVTLEEVVKYYNETAVYDNPARKGQPTDDKVQGVSNQLRLVVDVCGEVPKSVFQVGCSDGYTLSAFRDAGAKDLGGVDPGVASCKLASSLHSIETTVGAFEDYKVTRDYDLIVMTHILEHLFDPLEAVRKAASMQDDGGWIFVEVPLLERVEALPPGYFTFEHLNYFSESSMKRLLAAAEYNVIQVDKLFDVYDYPAIAMVARKENIEIPTKGSDFDYTRKFIDEYLAIESLSIAAVVKRLKEDLNFGREVYIWGAGVHTAQLLAGSDLGDYLKIKGLLDSSPARWGEKLGQLTCYNPEEVELDSRDTIVISSFASEAEIYDALMPLRVRGVTVLRLYGKEI